MKKKKKWIKLNIFKNKDFQILINYVNTIKKIMINSKNFY